MKMKKLIALSLSAMFVFSTVVAHAELTVDTESEPGYTFIDTLPTAAEIAARAPKVDIAVTKLATDAEVQAVGVPLAFRNNYKTANYDVYKMDVTISDLGAVGAGYDLASMSEQQICSLFSIEILLKTNAIAGKAVSSAASSKFADTSFTFAQHGSLTDYAGIGWSKVSGYPEITEEGDYVENLSIPTFTILGAVAKGEVVVIDELSSKIVYNVGPTTGFDSLLTQNAVLPTTLTLGEEEEEKELDMAIELDGKFDNGYVWTADLTQGEGVVNAFTATFVSGSESAQRSILNVGDLASKFSGAGTLSFNIGLNTTKVLDSATFTVADDKGASKAVAAPVN